MNHQAVALAEFSFAHLQLVFSMQLVLFAYLGEVCIFGVKG